MLRPVTFEIGDTQAVHIVCKPAETVYEHLDDVLAAEAAALHHLLQFQVGIQISGFRVEKLLNFSSNPVGSLLRQFCWGIHLVLHLDIFNTIEDGSPSPDRHHVEQQCDVENGQRHTHPCHHRLRVSDVARPQERREDDRSHPHAVGILCREVFRIGVVHVAGYLHPLSDLPHGHTSVDHRQTAGHQHNHITHLHAVRRQQS